MVSERKVRFDESLPGEFTLTAAFVAFAALLVLPLVTTLSAAQEQGQRTFHSAQEAGSALFAASQSEDQAALLEILGSLGKDIVSSGDPAEDSDERTAFVVKYQEMHRYRKDPSGNTVLLVGAENWPFPIALVNNHGAWYFDTEAGKEEVLMRRIGKNEVAAIDACHQLVDAEKQYYKKPFNGQVHYTERFISDKGKHNGLYWSEATNEFDSFIDPLIASAGQERTKSPSDQSAGDPIPYNGYYFRILTGQGQNAVGGAKTYVVDGKMLNGFAFVAYPAEYRSSGVMTFIVNDAGVVYEKDLGPDTAKIAASMTDYNPDSTWNPAEH